MVKSYNGICLGDVLHDTSARYFMLRIANSFQDKSFSGTTIESQIERMLDLFGLHYVNMDREKTILWLMNYKI